jgi:hypothetical protein
MAESESVQSALCCLSDAVSSLITASDEHFIFIVNGVPFPTDLATAVALSSSVALQISVDSTARSFSLSNSLITTSAIPPLSTFLSRSQASFENCESIILFFRFLSNPALEFAVASPFSVSRLEELTIDSFDYFLSNYQFCVDSEDTLLQTILELGPPYLGLLRHIQIPFLTLKSFSLFQTAFIFAPESIVADMSDRLVTISRFGQLTSVIIDALPPLLSEFRTERLHLLWRGSRDGFRALAFHRRCDGHANTLTIVRDTNGNIFGGFTPVQWESRVWNGKDRLFGNRTNCLAADESLRSYVFTIVNPSHVPPEKFPLRATQAKFALYFDAQWGPTFGCGFCVMDNCNENNESFARGLGDVYRNKDERGGPIGSNTLLTGGTHFRVDEIEVFEVCDSEN